MTWLDAGERAVDLREHPTEPDPAAVLAAVRDPDDPRVRCPEPGAVHEHVGHLHPELSLDRRGALAAAARSRGASAAVDAELRAARERLRAVTAPAPDVAAARERVAGTDATVEKLRERVARLQGRVRALREAEEDPAEATAELRAAARELAEVETDRVAAEQALSSARAAAREAFDARDRRLRLEDRVANLEREARAELARSVRPAVERALASVPGTDAGSLSGADDVSAALAVARVASLDAPVVVACDRFADPASAAEWLDARVVRVGPELK